MSGPLPNLVVARVLAEDDRFMTVEIAKDNDEALTLNEDAPDEFHVMAFVQPDGGRELAFVKPWEAT